MSNKNFEIRKSVGMGLFTRVPIRRGARVIEYTGTKIPTTLADTLPTKYFFDLENGFTIDGSAHENLARYVNHSCAPNCEAELKRGRIFFRAACNILADEEITIDYGPEYFNEFIKPEGCKCLPCKMNAANIV